MKRPSRDCSQRVFLRSGLWVSVLLLRSRYGLGFTVVSDVLFHSCNHGFLAVPLNRSLVELLVTHVLGDLLEQGEVLALELALCLPFRRHLSLDPLNRPSNSVS